MQFGILLQPQFEVAGAPDAELTSKNFFMRRTRFMVGGTVLKYFEYFFDVDYPNLFKLDPGTRRPARERTRRGSTFRTRSSPSRPWVTSFGPTSGSCCRRARTTACRAPRSSTASTTSPTRSGATSRRTPTLSGALSRARLAATPALSCARSSWGAISSSAQGCFRENERGRCRSRSEAGSRGRLQHPAHRGARASQPARQPARLLLRGHHARSE